MQASRAMSGGVHPLALLAVLLAAVIVSAAAGYLVRGGVPQAQTASQGQAAITAPVTQTHERAPDAADRSQPQAPADESAPAAPSDSGSDGTHGLLP